MALHKTTTTYVLEEDRGAGVEFHHSLVSQCKALVIRQYVRILIQIIRRLAIINSTISKHVADHLPIDYDDYGYSSHNLLL